MAWFTAWFGPDKDPLPEWQRAAELIAAIDAGGMPLNPARVNDIARKIGLDVSTRASVEDTIGRIRAALVYRRTHR
ncbi:MAG: hypothetical protein IPH35_26205 [Rhodoferax sp.]|nr:hypothetical protein [Rhodoferax sp.]